MISNGTQLQVTDNSGAKVAQCINQSGKSWGIGDVITVSIKKAQPRSKVAAGQVSSNAICFLSQAHDGRLHEAPACVRERERLSGERENDDFAARLLKQKTAAAKMSRTSTASLPFPPLSLARAALATHSQNALTLLRPSQNNDIIKNTLKSKHHTGPQGRRHRDGQGDAPCRRQRARLPAQRVRSAQREAPAAGVARARVRDARAEVPRADESAVARCEGHLK